MTLPTTQQERVEHVMADGRWRTLPELMEAMAGRFGAQHLTTSLSARLRECRKRGLRVFRKKRSQSTYEYRVERVPSGYLFDNRADHWNP